MKYWLRCDLPCVLILAGGVHRSLPPGTRMTLTGGFISNRLAPNMSDEAREGLKVRHGELFRLYLREMGVEPELLDMVDRNWASRQVTELPPSAAFIWRNKSRPIDRAAEG
jgi:hypothetical protein